MAYICEAAHRTHLGVLIKPGHIISDQEYESMSASRKKTYKTYRNDPVPENIGVSVEEKYIIDASLGNRGVFCKKCNGGPYTLRGFKLHYKKHYKENCTTCN